MSDSDILRDLYARSYDNNPLLEYVCSRWESLVEGEKDWQEEKDKLTAEKEGHEIRADELQAEVDNLENQLADQEKETARWEGKADELQMEVDGLHAQLRYAGVE
jgi:chromosome segregation ATPase